MKIENKPVRRGCPHCKALLPPKPLPRCPKCRKPLKAAAPRAAAPPPKPASKKPLILIGGGVAALLVIGVAAALAIGGDDPPPQEKPTEKPPKTAAKEPEPDKPVDPAPPPKRSFKDLLSQAGNRVDKMINSGDPSKVDYVAAAGIMEALREEAVQEGSEHTVNDWIAAVKEKAGGQIDKLFAPVREEAFKHLETADLKSARATLAAWEFPATYNVQGLCEEFRRRVEGVVAQFDKIDSLRDEILAAATPPEDVREPFAEFIDSEIEVVAAHARRVFDSLEAATRLARTLAALKKELDDRRESALARVEHARSYLAEQHRLEDERIARWKQRMVDGSTKSPFKGRDVDRRAGASIADKPAVLKDFVPGRLIFGGDWGTHTPALGDIPAPAYAKLAKWALDGAAAKDCYEFGVMCLRGGAYKVAEDCFKQAVAADAAYAGVVPDIKKVQRGIASFTGDLSTSGGTFKLDYDFDDAAHEQDFDGRGMILGLSVAGGALTIEGGPEALAVMKRRVRFAGAFDVAAKTGKVEDGAAILAVWMLPDEGDPDEVEVWADDKAVKVKRGRTEKKDVGEKPRAAGAEIHIEWKDGKLTVRQGKDEVWSDAVTDIAEVQVYLGVGAEKSGKAEFDALTLTGPMEAEVIRKYNAERTLVLEGELTKIERLVEVDQTAISTLPKLQPFPESLGDWQKHPLEEKIEGDLPVDVYTELRDAHRLIPDASDEDLEKAQFHLDMVVGTAPTLPLGWYYRAAIRNLRGDREGALADLDAAAKAYPYFMEAQVARATIYTERREYDRAQEALDQAIEAVPDMPDVYMQRALMHYYTDKKPEAEVDLELAVQLDPSNAGFRSRARGLRNVIRGPYWEADAIKIETPHYTILREPPPAGADRAALEKRMREWAEHLEAARPWFGEVMGRDPGKDPRTPRVLIFESSEGYHTFAEFTANDRIESSVGVFFRLYKQLMFYDESGGQQETIQTMVHEGFHQFLDGLAAGAPTWFNEGTAEYVSGIEVEGGKIVKRGLLLKGRLRGLQRRLREGGKPVAFEQILREPQWMFYRFDAPFKYAQAWSMVHFFMEGGDASYKQCYQEYAKLLLDSKSSQQAYDATFATMDLEKMLEDWKAYVEALKP